MSGESVAKLVLACISEDDGGNDNIEILYHHGCIQRRLMLGLYECRSHAGGQEVVVATKVEVVGHKPLSACVPR